MNAADFCVYARSHSLSTAHVKAAHSSECFARTAAQSWHGLELLEERVLLSNGWIGQDLLETMTALGVSIVRAEVSEAQDEYGRRMVTFSEDIPDIELTNVDAADTTNTDQLWPGGHLGLGLTGNGYRVGVWDGGPIRDTHAEFGLLVTTFEAKYPRGTIERQCATARGDSRRAIHPRRQGYGRVMAKWLTKPEQFDA